MSALHKRVYIVIVIAFFSVFKVSAQEKVWTLEECINYALQNNISLKQQQYNQQLYEVSLLQSRGMMLPSVMGSASHSYNYGRTVDRFTNEFAYDKVQSSNFYVSANITLFNGFQLLNSARKSKIDLEASVFDMMSAEQDIALTIATSFLQILYNMEMVSNAQKQYDLTLIQVDRTRKMVEAGALANNNLLQLEAQAASEEYQLISYQTQLEMSYLTLTQLMGLHTHHGFSINAPDITIENASVPLTADYIYEKALRNQPEIKSAELKVESAKKSEAIAKGGFSPTLTFGYSMGTGYSGASSELTGYEFSGYDTIGITTGSPAEYVLAPTFNYLYNPVSFSDQIDQNFNRTMAFNLSIPIFSSFQNVASVRRSKINLLMAESNLELTMLNLNKTIQQAHLDALSALKRYQAALKQVIAMQEVYRTAEQQFEVDDITLIEYQDAKYKLIKAESELLQAKYEYIFKMKILDFYLGNPITL